MSDTAMERVFCYDTPKDNSALWAALMNNGGFGNNGLQSLVWLYAMRWLGGNECHGNGNVNGQVSDLRNQISDNQNFSNLIQTLTNNADALRDIATATNTNIEFVKQSLCGLAKEVALGNTGIISAIKDCCCSNKEMVQKMGYESQLAQKDTEKAICDQTYTLNERMTSMSNGMTKGIADLGYLASQNKGEIINAIHAEGQATRDLLQQHWREEIQQKYDDARLELSQYRQNQYLINQLRPSTAAAVTA